MEIQISSDRVIETWDFEAMVNGALFKLYRLELAQVNGDREKFRVYRYRLANFGVPNAGIENWEQLRWEKQHYYEVPEKKQKKASKHARSHFQNIIVAEITAEIEKCTPIADS